MSTVTAKPGEFAIKLRYINDVLADTPLGEERRTANWLAIIQASSTDPGGLKREFLPKIRGAGTAYGGIDRLALFTAVEFGSDYYAHSGNRYKHRWYGVVVEKDETHFTLEIASSGLQACLLAAERAAGVPRPPPPPPPPIPIPPSEEELAVWKAKVEHLVTIFKRPVRGAGARHVLNFEREFGLGQYAKALDTLWFAAQYKIQTKEYESAFEAAKALVTAPRPTRPQE